MSKQKLIPIENGTIEQLQYCAKFAGLDETGWGADFIYGDNVSERNKQKVLLAFKRGGYTKINITNFVAGAFFNDIEPVRF